MRSLEEYLNNSKCKKTHVAAEVKIGHRAFYGVNVESSCHSLSCCAERVAIFNAITHIGPDFTIDTVTVIAEKENKRIPVVVCGACLQLISEYSTEETDVNGYPLRSLLSKWYK